MYIQPLRTQEPPIIARERLESFITDVFHNFAEIYGHHRKLLDQLQEIQREEHPIIKSVTAAVFDAALSFREAYLEYIPNYPIAAYRIADEMANNFEFKTFVDVCITSLRVLPGVLILSIAMYASFRLPSSRHEELHQPSHTSTSAIRVTSERHI